MMFEILIFKFLGSQIRHWKKYVSVSWTLGWLMANVASAEMMTAWPGQKRSDRNPVPFLTHG